MEEAGRSEGAPARRDRRGRGRRGPDLLPGPLAPQGVPAMRTRAERFDETALAVVEDIVSRWPHELARLDVAVEDVPVLGNARPGETVPLAALVPVGGEGEVRARLVLFRRPLERRAPHSREDLADLVLTVSCEELAPLVGVRPEDVHPDYPL